MSTDEYTHEDTYTRYNIELALKIGDLAYARELLRLALKTNPSADLWYLAALATSNRDEQIERLEQALALNPEHTRAALTLEETLQQTPVLLTRPPSLLVRLTAALRLKKV